MPTKFEEIYGRALFKFTDYSFLNPCCTDMKEAVLQKYLLSSTFKVSNEPYLKEYVLMRPLYSFSISSRNVLISFSRFAGEYDV